MSKIMIKIKTPERLLKWLETRFYRGRPKRKIAKGLVTAFHDIFGLVESLGRFELHGLPEEEMADLWRGKQKKAGRQVVEFVAAIYGLAIVQAGEVSLIDLVEVTGGLLGMRPGDLSIHDRTLVSSKRFEQRHKTKVRVRLTTRYGA